MNARGLIAAGALLLAISAASGAPDPAAKVPPPPTAGSVSPSGKFNATSPVPLANGTGVPAGADAEAALEAALKVRSTGSNTFLIGQVEFDSQQLEIRLQARVAVRTQIVEYALVTVQGKAYESLLTTEALPSDVHVAALLLGLGQSPVGGELNAAAVVPATNAIQVEVSWEANGKQVNVALADLISLRPDRTAPPRTMALEKWLYNGSVFDHAGFAARREGSIISLIRDPAALINNPGSDRDSDQIHAPNEKLLPPAGVPVQVVLRLPKRAVAPPLPPPRGVTPITPLSTNR
jgi:hypothetical protein